MIVLVVKVGTVSILVFICSYFVYANNDQDFEQPVLPKVISNLPTMEKLLMAAPTRKAQLGLWLIHSVLWYFICNIIAFPIVFKFINNMKSKKQYMELNRQTVKKGIGMDIGEDETAVSFIALTNTCLVQHTIGGLLSIPSGFGMASLLPPGIAYAMARHGNLCEMGWETQDTFLRLYAIVFGGEFARSMNPPGLWIALMMHHTASFCMVIPANIYYPDNVEFHELSCLLQLAATIAILFQHYGYTVNVKTAAGLSKMKVSVSISFAIIIWSRVIRYLWLVWNIGGRIWQDENWLVFKLFCVPAIGLTLVNVIMVVDATHKVFKFLPMSIKKDPEEKILDLATDAVSAGMMARRPSSCFGLSKSEKEWAKIRGVVRMGVFRAAAFHPVKED